METRPPKGKRYQPIEFCRAFDRGYQGLPPEELLVEDKDGQLIPGKPSAHEIEGYRFGQMMGESDRTPLPDFSEY